MLPKILQETHNCQISFSSQKGIQRPGSNLMHPMVQIKVGMRENEASVFIIQRKSEKEAVSVVLVCSLI